MAATAQDPHAPLRGGGDKAKDEDIEDVEYSPFYGIEKGAVLQEARIFHGPNLDPRRCQQVITKLLYLLNQGETFTKKEASEVFFAATKLFQNKDMNLRRMVYLCLKDICPGSDEVIIVTSSLMKDMNSTVDLYRSNSIRVLRSIIDSQLLVQIERYFKQAIVDKEPVVASAALVAGLHLLKNNGEVVKRWSEEIQAAVSNKSPMVQFHAIALLASIKATDRLAISKLVSSLTHGSTKSPLATCLLIKYITKVLKDTVPNADGSPRPFYDFLQSSLRHKSEMVMFQAARAIAEMKEVTMRELAPAITVLQLFLSSSKPVLRFTAVRTLNKVSMTHPMAVASCNIEMEHLMTDTNRSIATYAITTLLKTGSESSVERLLKQIGTFMSDIADDFKIVVVEAIRALCEKFPAKHRILMNFLAHTLREEGGFEYKKAIVDAILSLINNIEAAKESGLLHLSEFIEDCEFTYLATQVLHVLGTEGPKSSDPSKYIRFIYNRIILENATVRAAAVSALAAFGAQVDSLRERIVMLLKRTLQDNDDEVRDRSTLYIKQLTSGPQPSGTDVILHKFDVPLVNLEKALNEYLAGPMDTDFSLDAVDREVEEPTVPVKKGKKVESLVPQKVVPTEAEEFGKQVEQMPQFAGLGPRFKSCKAVPLTEEDTEYVVVCIKHIYTQHVLLQFNCTNTIAEQVLENVSMEVDLSGLEDVEVAEDLTLPLKRMPHNAPGSSYLVIEREEDSMPSGSAMAVMKFTVKEVDPATGTVEEDGYEDEYQLEDLNFNSSDYIKAKPVSNFKSTWDELDPDTEVADDYGLGVVEGITGTVESIMEHLGMACCEGTDVVAANARSHTIMLSGEFCGGTAVLARILFGLDSKNELAMKVVTRGDSLEASKLLHSVIQEA